MHVLTTCPDAIIDSAKFKANHYQRTPDEEIQGAAGMPPSNPHRPPRTHRSHHYHHPDSSQAHGKEEEHISESEFDEREGRRSWETDAKEVWFAGVHCGSSVLVHARNVVLTMS